MNCEYGKQGTMDSFLLNHCTVLLLIILSHQIDCIASIARTALRPRGQALRSPPGGDQGYGRARSAAWHDSGVELCLMISPS